MHPSTYALELSGIKHAFGQRIVLKGIGFSVRPGERVCLLGPSGAGKTTLLKIVAGLLRPKLGRVRINGRDQTSTPTCYRDIGFVFQSPAALFPHLNVYSNISFALNKGLRRRRFGDRVEKRNAIARMLRITGLEAHAQKSILDLSGGEKQRVALARALVYRPSLLLLDEPLSSLDNTLKNTIMELLLDLHAEYNTTFIYVTHDEREALRIATRIAVLDDGNLCQYGSTQNVTARPDSPKVAEIVGGWNALPAKSESSPFPQLLITQDAIIPYPSESQPRDGTVFVGVPAEETRIFIHPSEAVSEDVLIPVTLVRVSQWYKRYRYDCFFIASDEQRYPLTCYSNEQLDCKDGQGMYATFRKEAIHVFQQ